MKRWMRPVVPMTFVFINVLNLHTPRSAEPLSCSNASLRESMQRMVSGMSWPMGGAPVKVFKFYNYRDNPKLGTARDLLADTKNPCKVNILTNRGEFGFTYGWKIVDGDTFVVGQFGDPDEDAAN